MPCIAGDKTAGATTFGQRLFGGPFPPRRAQDRQDQAGFCTITSAICHSIRRTTWQSLRLGRRQTFRRSSVDLL